MLYFLTIFFLTWEITGTQVFYPIETPKNKMKKFNIALELN